MFIPPLYGNSDYIIPKYEESVRGMSMSEISLIQGKFKNRLERLSRSAADHQVMSNTFYEIWQKREFGQSAFDIFRANYGFRVGATVGRLSRALVSIDNVDARTKLWENLGDELGHGDPDRVHIRLFEMWADSLSERLLSDNSSGIGQPAAILPATKRFVDETNQMCELDRYSAAGAILAQEWHGYTQIAKLYDGYCQYKDRYSGDDFHDCAEYFYVHLGRAEKEHQVQATAVAEIVCQSDQDFSRIESSFHTYLNLLNDFWESLAKEIIANDSMPRDVSVAG